jgi:hypothetical protein
VVLVELGELEAQRRVVDRFDERREVGERERFVAARLGDLAPCANRLGPSAPSNRPIGDVARELERAGAPHRPRDAGPIDGAQAGERLTVKSH